ncbi:MAG TPA: SLC13 family permease [Tepidisphaeraceae bacterium]|nr:SLC13 family permease [Tepidisphaeraceae bacterium]
MQIDEPVPAEVLSPAEAAFERWRRIVGAVAAPLAFGLTWWLTRGNLSAEGQRLSAVLACVAVLWVSEALPLPVTALLGAVLCVVLGVAPAKTVLAYFADPIVFLFIGSFMLARAMSLHGLDRRIALAFLSLPWVGARPARMLAGVGAVTAVLSMWVSNTATTAMMLPIALGILSALHRIRVAEGHAAGPMDARAWPYATAMMLMVAYGASIGGIGTPVGSPPNLIGIGLIRRAAGVDITFFRWMALMVPLLVVMAAALFVLLYVLHPERRLGGGHADQWHGFSTHADGTREPDHSDSSRSSHGLKTRATEEHSPPAVTRLSDYVAAERRRLGGWTRGQINTLIAFGVAIALWVLPGVLALPGLEHAWPLKKWLDARIPESVAALSAAVLLFVLPTSARNGEFTLSWPEAAKIDWGTILLFGGGLSLGTLMFETGVAKALGEAITARTGATSLWALTALCVAIGIFLSETTSNTASANMVIPVAIALAQSAGVSPLPPALGACLGASFGFMLPVSTPPNAIAYGSGLVPIPRMIRAGVVFDVLGFVIILAGLRVLCPLLGLM